MISSLAYVDPSAKLGNNVTVHPFAYIDRDVEIGDDCEIFQIGRASCRERVSLEV